MVNEEQTKSSMWADLKFPPLNLYNAPLSPEMTELMWKYWVEDNKDFYERSS